MEGEVSSSRQAKVYFPGNVAEAKDGLPVASVGSDAFELVGLMFVASGDMSETRFRRAVDNVRKAVQR